MSRALPALRKGPNKTVAKAAPVHAAKKQSRKDSYSDSESDDDDRSDMSDRSPSRNIPLSSAASAPA